MKVPPRLAEIIDALDMAEDRPARIQMLIDLSRRFREVRPSVATRPWDEAHRVKGCESEVFIWATPHGVGTLDYHFAVDNPQGVTAKALAVILDDVLSGQRAEVAAALSGEIVYDIFGRDLSVGKSIGLTGMVAKVNALARQAAVPAESAPA